MRKFVSKYSLVAQHAEADYSYYCSGYYFVVKLFNKLAIAIVTNSLLVIILFTRRCRNQIYVSLLIFNFFAVYLMSDHKAKKGIGNEVISEANKIKEEVAREYR